MPLRRYEAKRDFERTPEPPGRVGRGQKWRFVVQQHAARRMHWDLRLELDGVLKSWAVPKGPSLNPSTQRLAIQTEDHPIAYATFDGVIPAGACGAGSMIVWDTGTWRAMADPQVGMAKGHLAFELMGHKLRGAWHLARTGGSAGTQWLLRKVDDVHSQREGDVLLDLPHSVLTQRLVSQITLDAAAKKALGPVNGRATARRLASLPRGIKPQLATLAAKPPPGKDWLYEVKLDGYRLIASRLGDDVRLSTRNGFDWTARLPSIAAAVRAIPLQRFVLDGELVVLDARGVSSFAGLQEALASGEQDRLVLCAFDLLVAADRDLRTQPQHRRKCALEKLLTRAPTTHRAVLYWPHISGAAAGASALAAAAHGGLEGLVAKRADAPYQMRRSPDWLKLKCTQQMACVVGGSAKAGGSLLVGQYDAQGALRYLGKVGTGITAALKRQLGPMLANLSAQTSPFVDGPVDGEIAWLVPDVVVQVRYVQRTAHGHLRHSSLLGLRPDKAAGDVRAEEEPIGAQRQKSTQAASKPDKACTAQPHEVVLTHPTRRLVPNSTVTKQVLADYMLAVGPLMLRHLAQRPLSVLRCPEPMLRRSFFNKHLPKAVVGLGEVIVDGKAYAYAQDVTGLLGLVQLSVIEWHSWGCLAPQVEAVDTIVFDLDPGMGVGTAQIIAAAHQVRQVLRQLGLKSLLKATGGKGLHVVVPGILTCSWPEAKAFGQLVADYVVAVDPKHFTATMAKAARRGKVFIDYFRNGRGATSIAAFSPRARPGLPVARPVSWQALDASVIEAPWSVTSMLAALRAGYADPWRTHRNVRQELLPQIRTEAVRHFKKER